jgi:hypothetical protein
VIVPEFDLSYSFESGLDEWYGNGVDLGDPQVAWSAERSSGQASVGSASVALSVNNAEGAAKVWIEREFTVEPSRAYDIEVTFDLGSSDGTGSEPWRVVAGAHVAPPMTAAELSIQDPTGNGGGAGVVFVQKSYSLRATSDEDGRMYLVIGVWGTSVGERTYFLDNVHVLFTRG